MIDTNLDRYKDKLVMVKLNTPLYVVERYELLTLTDDMDNGRLPAIKQVVGYLTRYKISNSGFRFGDYIVVNPFGSDHLVLDEYGKRAGDIVIPRKHVDSIKGLEEVLLEGIRKV